MSFPPISPNQELSKKRKAKYEIPTKPRKICQTPTEHRKDFKTGTVIKITSPIRSKASQTLKDPIMLNYNSKESSRNSKGLHFSLISNEAISSENNINNSFKNNTNLSLLHLTSNNNQLNAKLFNNSLTIAEEKICVKKYLNNKVSLNRAIKDCDNQNVKLSNRLSANFCHHQFGNIFNSLSSPESAYSTGYSTDGTSPGGTCSASPEYYVSVRTGTHYFPKSINNLAIETQRYKFGLNKIEEMSPQDPHHDDKTLNLIEKYNSGSKGSLEVLKSAQQLILNEFKSPSPRPRCRIRTNPWYSSVTDACKQDNKTNEIVNENYFCDKEFELDSASVSSSGIKSKSYRFNKKINKLHSEYSTCTSTESINIDNTPRFLNQQLIRTPIRSRTVYDRRIQHQNNKKHDWDPYLTFNEIYKKIDGNCFYEKETSILSSDSDETQSEVDTGQDAGDEYDTDDLLDVTCLGEHSAHKLTINSDILRLNNKLSDDFGYNIEKTKRRRIRKMRRKCVSATNKKHNLEYERYCKSVGGTPVCSRRNDCEKTLLPKTRRSNSLTLRSESERHCLMVSESEKVLLKADLEADFKYRQLINEAENMLKNMKSSALSICKETPMHSPRRVCNPPSNKRVEILRNCEADIKREQQLQNSQQDTNFSHFKKKILNSNINQLHSGSNLQKLSKKVSPKRNHITNFINQNKSEVVPMTSPRSQRLKNKKSLIFSESDSDENLKNKYWFKKLDMEDDISNRNYKQNVLINDDNYEANNNQNITRISFKSFDMDIRGNSEYCPQSEPLKRKIYSAKINQKMIAESNDNPTKRKNDGIRSFKYSNPDIHNSNDHEIQIRSSNLSLKQKVILLEDLQRTLEYQSVELNNLHAEKNYT
ncbi:hypothetical protein ACFFRR_001150 [Megaselia abdita]